MNKTILIIIVIVVIVIIGAIYINQSEQPINNEEVGGSEVLDVTVQNFAFSPAILTIKVGSTVTWTNNDSAPHTIKFDDIVSNTLKLKDAFQRSFMAPGIYNYFCSIHPSMKGKIIVQ